MTIEIRPPASIDEFRAGEAIIATSWRAAFADIVTEATLERLDEIVTGTELAERYRRYEQLPDIGCLLGLDAGVVGTASYGWNQADTKPFVKSGEAELMTLYVTPDRWGQGIGSALLDAVISHLPEATDRLVLETFTRNWDGRRFYETYGFYVDGSSTFAIAEETYPTVVYALDLQ